MSKLRVVIAVSPDRSDLYFANKLAETVNVVGILVENQRKPRDGRPLLVKVLTLLHRPRELLAKTGGFVLRSFRMKHAAYARPQHRTDFGEYGVRVFPRNGCDILFTPGVNDINSATCLEWLRRLKPDIVAVCGTSIMKQEFLSIPKKGVLNLHGGLSQRYRGLNTTEWAIYNEEPEYIGATIHYVSTGIDDGAVVYQGRPEVAADDTPSTLYVKVVKLGVQMMQSAIENLRSGVVLSAPLRVRGKLYLSKSLTPEIRSAAWAKSAEGAISNYVKERQLRDSRVLNYLINEYRAQPASGSSEATDES